MAKRGNQDEYNKLLNAFDAKTKTKSESVDYLIKLGFSHEQAENAVHVYWKGGETKAAFILSKDERDKSLDDFNAARKTPKECVDYLMSRGCTYRQATSAVYKYRQERDLIGK
ncbi:hypothetical protein ACFLTY_02540 [Chloroflexota bacterium]